ncbi:hypothetical protein CNMCM5793_006969 [Aspergillus hiratsukae]|uniref:LysM domain-containing protein n=1 Tax=Aspergillus hiratsukae TaxID=1194566 RepID=A0A8H6PHF8_9EURO|nr:hypothetical protein CNMCM5793_006969 [Aspergillus hiratsukae]
MDNITTLCTTTCQTSLQAWGLSVETARAGQTVVKQGVVVEAKALSLSLAYNAEIACLQDSPAICNQTGFDLDSVTPEMQAMTNLYNSSFFCSECFLELYQKQLLDPWLTPTNFTGYLIDQFNDLQQNYSTSLPYTTSSSTLYVGVQTATATTPTTTAATTATVTTTATPTCLGQLVQPITNWLTCNSLSDLYNVSTGNARLATGSADCYFNTTVCLPQPCPIATVWDAPSCASLANLASNATYNVSESQLLSWNPNILGSCDGVSNGQRVCLQAPGGTWATPPVAITAPTGTSQYFTTATPAYPTQNGTTSDCGKYYQVSTGDDCATVDLRFGLNFTTLQALNTFLDDTCSNL